MRRPKRDRPDPSSPPPPAADPSEADTLVDGESAPATGAEPRVESAGEGTLPEPPLIGRISTRWRRRLSESGWPRPGYAADGGEIGGFEILAASAVGQSHLHEAGQRQDAYHFAAAADGVIMAIADGVSAKQLAAIGAETAAFTAVRSYVRLTRNGSEPGERGRRERLLRSAAEAEIALLETAAELSLKPRELSTTLLLAHLSLGRADEMVVTTAAVGDSSALELSGESPPEIVSGPEPEGRSSHAAFLPGSVESIRFDTVSLRPRAILLLATDGLSEDLHASPTLRGWLWDRALAAVNPLEFAHALSYRRQGSSDDLTAVIARPAQG
jgi:serine/threonine protein phosphatase PrpC